MDPTNLFLSMIAGLVGMAMITISRRSGRLLPAGAGVALITCPYFIPNTVILTVICVALIALPFVFRDT